MLSRPSELNSLPRGYVPNCSQSGDCTNSNRGRWIGQGGEELRYCRPISETSESIRRGVSYERWLPAVRKELQQVFPCREIPNFSERFGAASGPRFPLISVYAAKVPPQLSNACDLVLRLFSPEDPPLLFLTNITDGIIFSPQDIPKIPSTHFSKVLRMDTPVMVLAIRTDVRVTTISVLHVPMLSQARVDSPLPFPPVIFLISEAIVPNSLRRAPGASWRHVCKRS